MYVIAGPTASGKTAVAVQLAKKIGGEVISADSMQVYTGMDIGTATPTDEEMAGVPHHLLNIIAPDEGFSAAQFQARAKQAICEIRARGAVPIIAGGTGFYINALLYGAEFSTEFSQEEELREKFADIARERGAEFLHNMLEGKDPVYAATLHANNVKRVARALAYIEATGELFSAHNAAQREIVPKLDANFFILQHPREILYERINARTLAMFNGKLNDESDSGLNYGLVEEVQSLLQSGYHKGLAAMCGIGYKETVRFLDGELTRDEAIAATAQATRNYAKRQETWFRNQSRNAVFLDAYGKTAEEIAQIAEIEG